MQNRYVGIINTNLDFPTRIRCACDDAQGPTVRVTFVCCKVFCESFTRLFRRVIINFNIYIGWES